MKNENWNLVNINENRCKMMENGLEWIKTEWMIGENGKIGLKQLKTWKVDERWKLVHLILVPYRNCSQNISCCSLVCIKVIIILVQEILQHVRPPNFEWFQSFYWYFTLEFGHQGFFEKNNHLPLMFLIWKHKLSLLGLKNRWANMLINLLNQKNNSFKKQKEF